MEIKDVVAVVVHQDGDLLPRLETQVPQLQQGLVFTILTRSPADSIAFIHDRMPVILPDDVKADWLNPKYAADDLIRHSVNEVQFKMA